MWDDHPDGGGNPLRLAMASSLRKVFEGRIEERVAMVWAQAIRSMIRGLIDWWSEGSQFDRLELEREFDALAGALLSGLALRVRPEGTSRPRERRGAAVRKGK